MNGIFARNVRSGNTVLREQVKSSQQRGCQIQMLKFAKSAKKLREPEYFSQTRTRARSCTLKSNTNVEWDICSKHVFW